MLKEKLKAFIRAVKEDGQSIVFSILSGWLLTLSGFSMFSPITFVTVPAYTNSISIKIFLLAFVGLSAALYCINRFWLKKALFIIMPLCFMLYGISSVALTATNAATRTYAAFIFSILSLVVLVLCINYAKNKKIALPTKDISFKTSLILVISAFVILSAYWITMLWARTAVLCTPGFDMGIFTQMYDNMTDPAQGFLPMTTCERGENLSHFAVHFSPILYLLMPFCLVFEPPMVLVFAQILLVLSGVFPVFLICREIKLSNFKTTVMSLLFLLYPVMSSGSFYDFHENAFLAPLILWTLYFSHKKKTWYNVLLMFVFALLVLMVKEDAAIYVAFISLYVMFGRKRYISGAAMFVMTVAYFFCAIALIAHFQQDMLFGAEGNMLSSRYANIIGEDAGFLSLVKVLILNPALYAVESLTINKLIYALTMLLPLAFLPLITRNPSRWLLLGPFYVLNLVTDYQYQHDIGYQYSFGSGALLVYLAVVNLADISGDPVFPSRNVGQEQKAGKAFFSKFKKKKEKPLAEAEMFKIPAEAAPAEFKENTVTVSESTVEETTENAEEATVVPPLHPPINPKTRFISFLTTIGLIFAIFSTAFIQAARAPAHFTYARRLIKEKENIEIINEVLADIDRDKSIFATSMFITPLYDADEVYASLQVFYSDKNEDDEYTYPYSIVLFTDVVILDLRDYVSDHKNARTWTNMYLLQGYQIVEEHEGLIRVLERTDASPETGYTEEYLEYRQRKLEKEQLIQEDTAEEAAAENNQND